MLILTKLINFQLKVKKKSLKNITPTDIPARGAPAKPQPLELKKIVPETKADLFTFFLKKNFNNAAAVTAPVVDTHVKALDQFVAHQYSIYCDLLFYDVAFYEALHMLFQIQSNRKQYFLTFSGINKHHFVTLSSGKLLSYLGIHKKGAKKSRKVVKYLVDYFESVYLNPTVRVTNYLLKPLNRKNINFFYEIQKYCKIDRGYLGAYFYFKTITARAARIKKRIKKKLLAKHSYYV